MLVLQLVNPHWVCPFCTDGSRGHRAGMPYPSALTDDQWDLVAPVCNAPSKRGRKHDLEVRRVGWDDKQPVFRPIRHAWL